MTYNVLSAEKEQGTLALALSQPVSLRTLVFGKMALRAACCSRHVVRSAAIALARRRRRSARAWRARAVWAVDGGRRRLWAVLVRAGGRRRGVRSAVGDQRDDARRRSGWRSSCCCPSLLNMIGDDGLSGAVAGRDDPGDARGVGRGERAGQQAAGAVLRGSSRSSPSGGAEQAMNDFNMVRVAVERRRRAPRAPVLDRYERQLARQQQHGRSACASCRRRF